MDPKWIRVLQGSNFLLWFPLVNVDILTESYFADSLKALGIEEFKSAISLENQFKERRKILRQSGEHHYYDDGVISSITTNFH
jgi:hypothetical protein